jgi:hypothetical protein
MTTTYTHVTIDDRARAEVRYAQRYDRSDSLCINLDGCGHDLSFIGSNAETFEHFIGTLEGAIKAYRADQERQVQEAARHAADRAAGFPLYGKRTVPA